MERLNFVNFADTAVFGLGSGCGFQSLDTSVSLFLIFFPTVDAIELFGHLELILFLLLLVHFTERVMGRAEEGWHWKLLFVVGLLGHETNNQLEAANGLIVSDYQEPLEAVVIVGTGGTTPTSFEYFLFQKVPKVISHQGAIACHILHVRRGC